MGAETAFFRQLVDTLVSDDEGALAVLQAYFDASEQAGIFGLAGFVFKKRQVNEFVRRWSALYDGYGFGHMTDLHNRHRQFDGIDDAESDRLCRGSIKIINELTMYGVAIGCSVAEMDACLPKKVAGRRVIGLGHHYPFCCHTAMQTVGSFLTSKGYKGQVAYFFESGDAHSEEAHQFLADVDTTPHLKLAYRHGSHTFIAKDKAVPLQAADTFAWEYARYWDRTVIRGEIPMRRSLVSMLSSNFSTAQFKDRYSVNFFTGPPLWSAMAKIGYAIEDQIAEEQSNLTSAQRASWQ